LGSWLSIEKQRHGVFVVLVLAIEDGPVFIPDFGAKLNSVQTVFNLRIVLPRAGTTGKRPREKPKSSS
jgi:hypothetical protein